MNNSTCRACGKAIVYMKTKAGKSMPCDEPLRLYWQSDTGSQRIITHAGEVVRCELTGISLTGAFESAYQTIKNRTGKTVNGVFVKEEDLQ